ncbi:CapA family protein [Sporosarcina beigongshangi]|uniref:CapA family protein n=1 Tax=Sporosarcina beigongshangi TaxID=2782538 RepID=UPI00193AB428|nr:CapA family protein [Sporosarcina beigongshangi]
MKRKIVYTLMIVFIISGWGFIAYSANNLLDKQPIVVKAPADFVKRGNLTALHYEPHSTTISIGMIGDILLHHPLFTYDNYDFAFAGVKDKLMGIDFLLANQESMPGGKELGLMGYPSFNSPKHIIRDLKANGVDMVSIANNHTIDRKEAGLRKALEHIKEYDMPYVGAYISFEDRAAHRTIEIEGIQIGVLSYTYGTNGNPVPRGKEYLVSLIDRERMQKEISHLSELVDVVVVSMHWGNEYQLTPSQGQEELAQFVSNAGADIIFGHHPHVLQKYEEVGKTKVFYSLGNFYSAQQFDSTNIGGIAKVSVAKIEVAGQSFVEIADPQFYPTAVKKDDKKRFVVVPLRNAGTSAMYDEEWVGRHIGVPSW